MADALDESLGALMKLDVVRVYLAETDEVVGGIGISIQPFLWNRSLVEMSELFFWVYPGSPATAALALLRRVMSDADAEKVDLVTFARLETSPSKVAHLYERLGFRRLQETYLKEFSWP